MKCIICNKEIKESKFSHAILCSSECFSIHFWNEKIEIKDNTNIARIDGDHYTIAPDSNDYFKGFGGRKFTIEFNDDRIVETKNLWHQGTIPESHKDLLPNNAKFI